MRKAGQDWAREKPAGDHLPYLAQIDDHTVMLRDGRLMQVLMLDGLLFETADTAEINYRKALRDAMLQTIGSSRFALYHHVIRRRVEPQFEAPFPDPFSAEVDAAWRDRLASKRLFSNDLFLCILRRPLQGRGGVADRISRWFGRVGSAGEAEESAELRALNAARDALLAALGTYGAKLLGSYDGKGGLCSEVLEYLSGLYNGELRPVRLPECDIGQYLPARRISFGADTIELGATGEGPRSFQAMLSIKDYPGQTGPGMLDELLRLPFELTVTQSFGFVDRQAALGRVNLALRRMRAADDEALSLRGELAVARDDLAAGRAAFGEHHLTIAVRADTLAQVDDGVAEVQATLTDLGLVAVREDMALEPAFWAQFPGNFSYVSRRSLVASRNFASLASLHNFPVGKAEGNHWGSAVTVLETTAAGPYHFNFHHGDLGNFTVIGPSGTGKTVVLNFLLAQARKYDPRIVFFDKDRGAELFLRAIGGRYDVLRPGEPSGLNPLLLDDTAENRRFLVDWLSRLVADSVRPLDSEDLARIVEAVDANMEAPRPYRRLAHFAQLLRGQARPNSGDLASRLAPWWGSGERAWLFDNAEDRTDLAERVVGFDMTRILDNPIVRTPAMMYLFHRVEERLDGTPSIIVVDEGWKALDDEVFTARIRDWEKTIRKRNGIVGFATQSAEDALSSRIASAIVEQAATQIFMPNPKAQARDYMTGFGLTSHEYDLIRTMPDNARAFLVKHGQDSIVARLDLSGNRDLLTILSAYLDVYLAPFLEQLARPDVTDLYVNRAGELWIETLHGGLERHAAPDITEAQLWRLARQVASLTHQGISREHPLLAARLPDGARVQIVAPPATREGMVIAIRKHVSSDLSPADYEENGAFANTLNADATDPVEEELARLYEARNWSAFLSAAVRARKTILVSGGTSTGKTTFLNALLREIAATERLVLIEDTPELVLRHENAIGLIAVRGSLGEANVTTEDLLIASLRLRPDRIILGELRGVEALTFLRAINTGHPGSMTTIHADTPTGAIEQLILLVLQSGARLNRNDILAYVNRVVDVIIQLERRQGRRSISQMTWLSLKNKSVDVGRSGEITGFANPNKGSLDQISATVCGPGGYNNVT